MSAVVEVGFVRGWNSLFDVLGEYLPPIFLGGSAEGVARKHRSNKCKRFKTKAGFGEGTPQQVRPVSETQFQILKLWPQVDTCLSLFRPKQKYGFQIRFRFPKLGVQVPIEVFSICGSHRLHRICVPAPVLQRRYPARPRFTRGHGAVSRSRRLVQFSKCGYEELQAGRPSANSLGK